MNLMDDQLVHKQSKVLNKQKTFPKYIGITLCTMYFNSLSKQKNKENNKNTLIKKNNNFLL